MKAGFLPKGTVEPGEDFKQTALREVHEETGVAASIIKYIGKSQYTFNTPQDTIEKTVHWYLMMATATAASRSAKNTSSIPATINFMGLLPSEFSNLKKTDPESLQ